MSVSPEVHAQGNSKAKKNAAVELDFAEPELAAQGFGEGHLDLTSRDLVIDIDSTAEGQMRLREVEHAARVIYQERVNVERERRPLAAPRDFMVGEFRQALAQKNEAAGAATGANRTIAQCNRQLPLAQGQIAANLRAQLSAAQQTVANATAVAAQANALMLDRKPKIDALNLQIKPFDDRLRQLWNELEECRKQWLDLRQPVEKYARGDFELLRKVLDDWLLIDGLWPQAFTWGALCAYELGEYTDALDYLDRAEKLRVEVFFVQLQWPELSALYGMVNRKLPGQSVKANKALADTVKLIDKNVNWEAYFLLARCYSERDNEHLRAKANFEHALRVRPNSICAQMGLARLQTISTLEKVRDHETGTKKLERLWEKTGKRSWRLAYYLVEAYDATGRKAEADALWDLVMESDATREWKEQARMDRLAALNRAKN